MSDMLNVKKETSNAEYFPLSFSQRRLWLLDQISPKNSAYNVNTALRLRGSLRPKTLQEALQILVNRHEIFRIITINYDGEGLQTTIKDLPANMRFLDMSEFVDEDQASKVRTQLYEEANKPFELTKAPLFRFCLMKLADNDYVFSSVFHHIIVDAWSLDIISRELAEIYNALIESREPSLPELEIQYIDFASWHRDYLQTSMVKDQLRFWKEWLGDAPDITTLPLDKQRTQEMSHQGSVIKKSLEVQDIKRLDSLSTEHGVTLFTMLLTLYQVALAKISSQVTVVVGTPFLNRHYPEVENLIGFFSNTLPIRLDIENIQTLKELLKINQTHILDATENQDIPFEQIIDVLCKERSFSVHPIFQTLFSFKNKPIICDSFKDINVSSIDIDDPTAKFDLVLLAIESEEGLDFYFEYATELFSKDTVVRFSNIYLELLQTIDSLIDKKFIDIVLPTDNKLSLISKHQSANTPLTPEINGSVMDLIYNKALEFPNNVALSTEEGQITYKTLIEKANQLSNFLKSYNKGTGARIIIALPRGMDSILSLLAVLQNGCAYIPIDLNWPKERQQFILNDSSASIVLTYSSYAENFNPNNKQLIIALDERVGEIDKAPKQFLPEKINLEDIAYIIYTSGSTGKPKGVLVSHRGIANLACSQAEIFKITSSSRVLQFASLSFDAVISEWSTTFSQGATLCLLSEKSGKLKGDLVEILKNEKISIVTLPPSVASILPLELSNTLKTLVLAGEAGNSALVNNWSDKINLVNAYGPTEATVCATFHVFSKGDPPTVIGKPIHNVQVYIMDEQDLLVPPGKTGEIVIGGLGVAKGYLNREELTQSQFIPDVFSQKPGVYLYKTGDLGKYDESGNIIYVGRLDSQVKLRGYRIELGEIEQVLMDIGLVSEAVVSLGELRTGQKALFAYIKLTEDSNKDIARTKLIEHLKMNLPSYMIPSKWTFVSSWPINSSGKIDRKLLFSKSDNDVNQPEQVIDQINPTHEIENILLDIWSKLLKRENIQKDDDFFKLGGDSIIAVQCVTRARKQGIELSVKQLFTNPSISKLAQCCYFIENSDPKLTATEEGESFPLAPPQQWFFNLSFHNIHYFNQSISLETNQKIDGRKLERVLKLILKTHSSLRLRFKKGHDKKWQQYYQKLEETYEYKHGICEQVILDGSQLEDNLSKKKQVIKQLQSSLNIESGPIFKAVLFKGQQKDILVIVCHHLAIDGVSWRILLNDLEEGYSSAINNNNYNLTPISKPYSWWVKKIYSLAEMKNIQQEESYWDEIIRRYNNSKQVKRQTATACALDKSEEISDTLTSEETKKLIQTIPEIYQTHINDILITALCFALKNWLGSKTVAFMLEGHGREQLSEDMALDRSIGWFTSIYPVVIDFEGTSDLISEIGKVKDTLSKIPKKGAGFGILNYCSNVSGIVTDVNDLPNISFNYLGQWAEQDDEAIFKLSDEEILENYDPNNKRIYAIDINTQIYRDIFQFSISYDPKLNVHNEIIRFKNDFFKRLKDIINQSQVSENAKVLFSANYPLCKLDSDTLRHIFKDMQPPEDLYPLSPMQNSMLATAVRSHMIDPYIRHNLLEFSGHDVNPLLLKQAWQSVIDVEPIFRTGFIWENLVEPLQYVSKKAEIIWQNLDWSMVSPIEQNEKLQILLDQDSRVNFTINQPPLARFSLIQLEEFRYVLLWSMHHIIMDGWCTSIIIQVFLDNYKTLLNDQPIDLYPAKSYGEYIKWLQYQDQSAAESFWKNYLKDARSIQLSYKEGLTADYEPDQGYYYLEFNQEKTEHLKIFASQSQFTLNHIIQAAWAYLISKYSQSNKVTFGVTVSGRAIPLEDVDRILGLFINTLPLYLDLEGDPSFIDILEQVKEKMLLIQQYGYVSLQKIHNWIGMGGKNLLFDNLYIFENYPIEQSEVEKVGNMLVRSISSLSQDSPRMNERTEFPLVLGVAPTHKLLFSITYDKHRFEPNQIEQIGSFLENILNNIASYSMNLG